MSNEEVWLMQLWSGLIGAGVAAVFGAIVAIAVVVLTNRHQTKLDRDARERAAISTLIVAVSRYCAATLGGRADVLRHQDERVVPAIEAWKLEARPKKLRVRLQDELDHWAIWLIVQAQKASDAHVRGPGKTGSDEATREYGDLQRMTEKFTNLARQWSDARNRDREKILEDLKKTRPEWTGGGLEDDSLLTYYGETEVDVRMPTPLRELTP
jgi:hypothetical protein